MGEKIEKLKDKLNRINPFHVKSGDTEVKWLLIPKAEKETLKTKNLNAIGSDLVHKSKLKLSISTPISHDVDASFNYKGNLENSNTKVSLKFTKKF